MSLRTRAGHPAGWILGSITAGLLLSACGSTTTTGSAPPSSAPATSAPASAGATATPTTGSANFDSCSVVTQSEASSAIGESVSAGVLGNATVEGGLACVFYGPSAPTPHDANVAQNDTVRVVVVKGANALTWYDNYKASVSAQAISGYGDQAFYDGVASLSVLKGDSYLRIAVSPSLAPPSLSDEEKLATAILPSL